MNLGALVVCATGNFSLHGWKITVVQVKIVKMPKNNRLFLDAAKTLKAEGLPEGLKYSWSFTGAEGFGTFATPNAAVTRFTATKPTITRAGEITVTYGPASDSRPIFITRPATGDCLNNPESIDVTARTVLRDRAPRETVTFNVTIRYRVYDQHDQPLEDSDMGDKQHQVRENKPFRDFYNPNRDGTGAIQQRFEQARMTLQWRDSPCVFSDRQRLPFYDSDFVSRDTNSFANTIREDNVVVRMRDHWWQSSISGEHVVTIATNNGRVTFTAVEDNRQDGDRRRVFAFRLRYEYTITDTRGD